MNYIFSFKTNDNLIYNLICNQKDKLYSPEDYKYLELVFYKDLLETIEGKKSNFNIGGEEYYLFNFEFDFSYKQLYLYFNKKVLNIDTLEPMMFFGDPDIEKVFKENIIYDLELLNKNVNIYRILFDTYPNLYKTFLSQSKLIYNDTTDKFEPNNNTDLYYHQMIPRNSYKIYKNAIVLNIPVYIIENTKYRHYYLNPDDIDYDSEDSCADYEETHEFGKTVFDFKLFDEFTNNNHKKNPKPRKNVAFNFSLANINFNVYMLHVSSIENDFQNLNIYQEVHKYNVYDLCMTIDKDLNIERTRFFDNKLDIDVLFFDEETKYKTYYYKLHNKITYDFEIQDKDYYEQFVIWLK